MLGRNGELRKRIEAATHVRIVDRGVRLLILADPPAASPDDDRSAIRVAEDVLRELLTAVRRGHAPSMADLNYALQEARGVSTAAPSPAERKNGLTGWGAELTEGWHGLRPDIRIRPRTSGQKRYLKAIQEDPLTLVIGPAGTGKTYLAMAAAVSALLSKSAKRLILTRPAVEAGESLGFLPGDLEQKVNPYLRPLHDALYSMVDADRARRFIEREQIEVAPLAYMRGRTLDNAFVILDEAQNTTTEQMLMFLTRLGEGSRAVVTGDITQIDLPKSTVSGLVRAQQVLRHVEGVSIIHLSKWDVVRHPLVQRIVDAYEKAAAEEADATVISSSPASALRSLEDDRP